MVRAGEPANVHEGDITQPKLVTLAPVWRYPVLRADIVVITHHRISTAWDDWAVFLPSYILFVRARDATSTNFLLDAMTIGSIGQRRFNEFIVDSEAAMSAALDVVADLEKTAAASSRRFRRASASGRIDGMGCSKMGASRIDYGRLRTVTVNVTFQCKTLPMSQIAPL